MAPAMSLCVPCALLVVLMLIAAAHPTRGAAADADNATVRPLVDWRVCDDEGVFVVTGGEVEPYPAHGGDEVVFRVHGSSDVDISGGTLEIFVDYLGFHVYASSGALCDALPCPLAAGHQTLTFRQQLPKAAPPGPYLGVFQARDEGGTLLFCVDLNFRIALDGSQDAGGTADRAE